MSSTDRPEQSYAWYRDWLHAHGWQQDASYPLLTTQLSLQGYARGQREKFYVAIDDPRSLGQALRRPVPQDQTVFEHRYLRISYWRSSERGRRRGRR